MIWDFIVDEFRKNNGSYLRKIFRSIYVEYMLGVLPSDRLAIDVKGNLTNVIPSIVRCY